MGERYLASPRLPELYVPWLKRCRAFHAVLQVMARTDKWRTDGRKTRCSWQSWMKMPQNAQFTAQRQRRFLSIFAAFFQLSAVYFYSTKITPK